jgi:hypothetical protein
LSAKASAYLRGTRAVDRNRVGVPRIDVSYVDVTIRLEGAVEALACVQNNRLQTISAIRSRSNKDRELGPNVISKSSTPRLF